jgi:signal transduction histidine kinase
VLRSTGFDPGREAVLAALSERWLESGRIGLVTLDPDRRVSARHGRLVRWFPLQAEAADAIPFLVGLEQVLDEVAAGARTTFELAKLGWVRPDGAAEVLSLSILKGEAPGTLEIWFQDETETAALHQELVQSRNELALREAALIEARATAEAALRAKAAFLANVSHDLKTPLQVIIGNAEILGGADVAALAADERDLYLEDIRENGAFLLSLITDLLEGSALEAGKVELAEEPVALRPFLERLLAMVRQLPEAERREISLEPDGADHRLLADPMRLQRLLLNLLANAVQYSGAGGRVRLRAGTAGEGDLLIEVEDDGPGIEPTLRERLFEPFSPGANTRGSGLGLHIAKGIAEVHGATLDLASPEAGGTKASLRLPASRLLGPDR